jgi:hypothetical protein
LVRDDEIQSRARSRCAAIDWLAAAAHPLGQAPGPNRHRSGGTQSGPYLAEHPCEPPFFGGTDVRQRPSGLEDFSNRPCRSALGRLRWCGQPYASRLGISGCHLGCRSTVSPVAGAWATLPLWTTAARSCTRALIELDTTDGASGLRSGRSRFSCCPECWPYRRSCCLR